MIGLVFGGKIRNNWNEISLEFGFFTDFNSFFFSIFQNLNTEFFAGREAVIKNELSKIIFIYLFLIKIKFSIIQCQYVNIHKNS